MKKQLIAGLFIATLSATAFALPQDADNTFKAPVVAEGGADRTGTNRVAEDGSDRTGANRIAEGGSERTGINRIA
ncbi:phage infection protein, partial [Pseudomonas sp. PIC25]